MAHPKSLNFKSVNMFDITYLPEQDLFKIDYYATDDFASLDVVKGFDGIIASLMYRQPLLFNRVPALADPVNMMGLISDIRYWLDIDQPQGSTGNDSNTFVPTPQWT